MPNLTDLVNETDVRVVIVLIIEEEDAQRWTKTAADAVSEVTSRQLVA